jgi:hypothetical protein
MNQYQVLFYQVEAPKEQELRDALAGVVDDLKNQLKSVPASELEKLPKRVDFSTGNNSDGTFVMIALVALGDDGIPTNWNPPKKPDILLNSRTREFILEFVPVPNYELAFCRV